MEFAKDFCKWLTSMTAGSKPENQAEPNCIYIDIDFYMGSGRNVSDFINNLESKTGMSNSGQLGYMNAFCDLFGYRKYQGVTSQVLQNFAKLKCFLEKHENVYQRK